MLLVVSMAPEFFTRLVDAGNAVAGRMDAEFSLSDFCKWLMHEALETMAESGDGCAGDDGGADDGPGAPPDEEDHTNSLRPLAITRGRRLRGGGPTFFVSN